MLSIKKPTLLLNSDTCHKNIHTMTAKSEGCQVIFRPHFKTHQSAAIGKWFREAGVSAITVSSVSMAQYFAMHGWKDITIAFPVNILEIEEINLLVSSINLNLLVESEETALFLSNNLTSACGFFIKIDTGYRRTGIEISNIMLIDKILQESDPARLHFKGFLTQNGHAYEATDKQQIIRIQQHAAEMLLQLKKQYLQQYPGIIISEGDTPTCSQLKPIEGIDEIRPGNFVFFDVMQFALGSCTLDQIAVALICPIVAVHFSRKEAVIYGGAIHLSKDRTFLPPDPKPVYGLVVRWDGKTWHTGELLGKVSALSQEHGVISLTQAGFNLKPGDLVAILPVHSCLTANLMRRYYTLDGEKIKTMNQ